mgnify:CR=1 FL=1
MKAPWKISLQLYSSRYTFFIGNQYIYLYDTNMHKRKTYPLTDDWKLALTVFSQSENIKRHQDRILEVAMEMFQSIDQFGSFSLHDYFNDDDLEDARKIIGDYEEFHAKERAANLKHRKKYKTKG